MYRMPYSFKNHYLMFAHYNQWVSAKLYVAIEALSVEQQKQDCGAYFKSILHMMNHLYVGDVLWLERICGYQPSGYALDEVLYPNVEDCIQVRRAHDFLLLEHIQSLSESAFTQDIHYIRRDQRYCEPLAEILAHVFNHQSHHRGQLHAMIYQLTGVSLELDLIDFQRAYAELYRTAHL